MYALIIELIIFVSVPSCNLIDTFVLDGSSTLFLKYSKSLPELEEKLTNAFAIASTTSKYNKISTNVSIRFI